MTDRRGILIPGEPWRPMTDLEHDVWTAGRALGGGPLEPVKLDAVLHRLDPEAGGTLRSAERVLQVARAAADLNASGLLNVVP